MRTEAEIRREILALRDMLYESTSDVYIKDYLKARLWALQWVLGEIGDNTNNGRF